MAATNCHRCKIALMTFFAMRIFSVVSIAGVVPQPREGWTMQLVAEAPTIRHPSVVCSAPDGRVFVAEDPMDISSTHAHVREGRIVCLFPDGRATVFVDGLYAVFGMQFLKGKLYVLHNPKLTVFTDDDGIGKNPVDLIEQTNPNPWALDWNDHVPANFRLAMDGYFYVAVGDKGLFGAVDRNGHRIDLHGGGVVRIRPDGTGLEIFSTGVRNILDVAVNDEDELFTYDNTDEHDWMGRLTHMVDGGFYGYPFDFVPRRAYTLWMFADFGPGAATGALVWNDDSLPKDFRSNLILADFGQRNLRRVRIERNGATFSAVTNELLFPNPPADFRPVGIHETADGSGFYICDWQHADNKDSVTVGRLWKLTANFVTNGPPKPAWYLPASMGKPFEASLPDLISGMSHPQKIVRLTAQRALKERRRFAPQLLVGVMTNSTAPVSARLHALWALDSIDGGVTARQVILKLAGASPRDVPAAVIRQSIRQLGERQIAGAVPILIAQLKNSDASIRFQAVTALRRIGISEAVPALIESLNEPDLFARFAVFHALNHLGRLHPELWPRITSSLDSTNESVREAAGFALRETFDLNLVKTLAATASDKSHPVFARAAALRLLAAVHHQAPTWNGEWWAYHPALSTPPARTVEWPGTKLVIEALRQQFDDVDPTIRISAVEGLRLSGDTTFAARLREYFPREKDVKVQQALLDTLGDFEDFAFTPALAQFLKGLHSEPSLLNSALVAAGKIASDAASIPALSSAITNLLSRPGLPIDSRVAALDALGQCKLQESAPWFERFALLGDHRERAAALAALVRLGNSAALTTLRRLLAADRAEVRRDAIAALGRLKQRDAVADLLRAFSRTETREAAMNALTDLPDIRAIDAYLEGLASANIALRDKCRNSIGNLAGEALPLLQTRRDRITAQVVGELRRIYESNTVALRKPLFVNAPRFDGPDDFERYALHHSGDPWRGQQLFFDLSSVACIKCHAVAGHGGALGPDLTTIGAQFGRAALIESILYPSKVVREGYQQYNVETLDDESFSGAIRAESSETITLVDTEGRTYELKKSRIRERRSSALSLMPEGLQAALTLEQFTDLIAFVESLRVDPRRTEAQPTPPGFEPLFNGRDLSGWNATPHWSAHDGLIEHDGIVDDLWSTKALGDFKLRLEWRWPDEPHFEAHPAIGSDGYEVKDAKGAAVRERVLEAGDSGVFLRGFRKAQINLFCYPIGSGEFWEYRESLSGEPRRALTPSHRADRPIGQWNELRATLRGDRVTVNLNGVEVIHNAWLPELPLRGPVGFQHEHGRLQIRNIFVREIGVNR